MTPHTFRNLKQRLAVSAVALLGLCVTLIFASYPLLEPLFVAVLAAVAGVALREYFSMAKNVGAHPLVADAVLVSTGYIFSVYAAYHWGSKELLPNVLLIVSVMLLFCRYLFHRDNSLMSMAITVFGLVWITLSLSCLVRILFFDYGGSEDGRWWFMYLLATTKTTDAAAFFVGKKFGQRKLAERISPKKTVEGAFGGLFGAMLAGFIFYLLANTITPPPMRLGMLEALTLSLLLGIVGQLGDLAESVVKRNAKVKDSSAIPGLGGVLDIVDSVLFSAPVLTVYLLIR